MTKGEIFTETVRAKRYELEIAYRVTEVQSEHQAIAECIGIKRTDLVTGEVVEHGEDDVGTST